MHAARAKFTHFIIRLAVALASLMAPALAAPACAQPVNDQLRLYGVGIWHTPRQNWGPGGGVWLGGGRVLTAAHVVGRAFLNRPVVAVAGLELPATVLREGSLAETDLTLLQVDDGALPVWMRMRQTSLCTEPPRPGQPVLVVVRGNVITTEVLSPAVVPAQAQRFSTVIGRPDRTASSGSPVFDAATRCLMGIVSRKISAPMRVDRGVRQQEMKDVAVYFVPAAEIRGFLAGIP